MEESVVPEALFLPDYSMFIITGRNTIKLVELWNVVALSLFCNNLHRNTFSDNAQ